MNKQTFVFIIVIMLLMCGFFVWRICSSVNKSYEGYVIGHTEDGLIIELEVDVTPEELIGYEIGDPYIIGGK